MYSFRCPAVQGFPRINMICLDYGDRFSYILLPYKKVNASYVINFLFSQRVPCEVLFLFFKETTAYETLRIKSNFQGSNYKAVLCCITRGL